MQFQARMSVIIDITDKKMMKRTILILLAMLTLVPAAVRAQDDVTLYNGWGIGFEVGAGALAPTGSLNDNLKACALFTGGINAEYGRVRLKADMAFGQPSLKIENPYNVLDEQGRNAQLNATSSPTLLGFGLQLGYTVLRQGRVSVTPMVGLNFNRLSWNLNNIKYEPDDEGIERPAIESAQGTHENSLGWMASVDIDIKLHGSLVDNPFGDNQSHYVSSLRVSPFVAYVKYGNLAVPAKGCCVGATITYAGVLRLLR